MKEMLIFLAIGTINLVYLEICSLEKRKIHGVYFLAALKTWFCGEQ